MMQRLFPSRVLLALCGVAFALWALAPAPARAADSGEAPARSLAITAADRFAAAHVLGFHAHVLAARTPAGALGAARRRFTSGYAAPRAQVFYPANLTYFGGPVLKSAIQHNAYVNEPDGATWGYPAVFEKHLSRSTFVHLTDQYVGSTGNDRYPVGAPTSLSYPISGALQNADIAALAHAAAKKLGATGLGHIIHLFFAPGVDICFTGSGECYSPDNPSTFYFCAYHNSIEFSDLGTVLISVEPYQPVSGCGVDYGGNVPANSELIDGTATVLSHETIESITDPTPYGVGDPRSGWVAASSFDEFGAEIGDECEAFAIPTNIFDGQAYTIQNEYSNHYHACANAP